MPGFSTDDQRLVAALVRGHRRKFSRSAFANLPVDETLGIRLCVLLRLAVLLNRGRAASSPVSPEVEVEGETVRLRFPAGWLARHPLTAADLEREVSLLEPVGVSLRVEAAVDAPARRG
jgi:exopolyphosphatase/guanosine-5'-triphosphate,3'-diphosphate pyrophosphatase